MGDGDQTGLWGQTTNTNLGTLVEQAITGVTSIAMSDANYTLTSFNGITDEARNAVLVVTGANNSVRDLIPPVVEKLYTIVNNTTGGFAIRVIGGSGTGVNIPNGATCLVYCDGTNFVNGLSGAAGNFSISGALAVTGTTVLTGATTITGALGGSTATFSGAISSVSPTFTGTPLAPTASPGTNTTQIATTAFVNAVTGTLGTMATQNANNVSITGGTITGITDLAVADGGTGASTLTSKAVLIGNGTSAVTGVSPGTSGNVLKSDGTSWTSAAPAVPSGLGLNGETWHSESRAASTVYQNNRAYPIMVNVGGLSTGSSVTFYCDATTTPSQVAATSNFGGSNVNGNVPSVIVPPYFYYSCTASSGTWYELY